MNRKSFFIGMGMSWVLIAAQAHGGYRDMKKELESYAPPAYLMPHAQPAPHPTVARVNHRAAFETEKKRIEALAAGWEKTLGMPEDTHFYRPALNLPESFRQTAKDEQATAKALASGISLDALEAFTVLRNPGVKSAENQFRAAIEAFGQVSNLDEILRTYSVYTESLSQAVGPMKGNGKDTVKPNFPFPGLLSLKGEVVNQAVSAARQSLEAAARDAVTAARKTYWNLLFNRKAQQITRETLSLLSDLESVAAIRYEAGKTSYQDVIKVRIQKEKLAEELVTLKETQKNLELKVLELLDLRPANRVGAFASTTLPFTIPALFPLYDQALKHRQELCRLRAMVGKTERMIEMAETMILPPYTLNFSLYDDEPGLQVGSSATKPAFSTTLMATRGVGLPMTPWYGSDDAYLRQTRKKLASMRDDLKKAETETITMVRNAWFDLDRAKRERALYRDTVIKLSRSALDASTQGYEAGAVSFADVIGSYTEWLNAGLTLESKQRDLGISWAELARMVGVDIKELSVER
ncbi:MAG: TolC family protein [Desulfobacterales bacterium]|jgi:outer membrane protein TolC|nr:TolC family protein [Desulfobacterales bacterium]